MKLKIISTFLILTIVIQGTQALQSPRPYLFDFEIKFSENITEYTVLQNDTLYLFLLGNVTYESNKPLPQDAMLYTTNELELPCEIDPSFMSFTSSAIEPFSVICEIPPLEQDVTFSIRAYLQTKNREALPKYTSWRDSIDISIQYLKANQTNNNNNGEKKDEPNNDGIDKVITIFFSDYRFYLLISIILIAAICIYLFRKRHSKS